MSANKWCSFNPSYRYIKKNHDLTKILDFYVWNCPVEGVVPHAKTFEMLGFDKSYKFKSLKNSIRCSGNVKIPYITSTRKDMSATLQDENQYNSRKFSEIIILLKHSSSVSDLFRCIRNAFAHGTFYMEKERDKADYFLFLENRNSSNEINARIVLKSSTLLRWIKIINKGY